MVLYDPITGAPLMGGGPSNDREAPARSLPITGAPTGGRPNLTRYQRLIQNLSRPAPVMEVNRFPYVTTVSGTTIAGGPLASSTLVISKPDQLRIVLMARNDATSPAGSFLYVAFGQSATDATAWFKLTPGAQVYLDTVIPQDDIYVSGSVAAVNFVLGYANSFLQMMPLTR